MTRAVLVGVAAALVLVMLLSISAWVELRYTRFGEFMHDANTAVHDPNHSHSFTARYGDPFDFLGRWLRLNQLLVDPGLCAAIGVLIGLFTRRIIPAMVIGIAPIVVINRPPDRWAALSIGICLVGCWSVARATRYAIERRSQSVPRPA